MPNLIMKTGAAALVAAMALGASLVSAPTPAEASEHCKGVYINVSNPSGKTVKVIDIDYWDESANKWRSEPVRNRVLRKGESWSWRRKLERVAAENTRIRIEYRTYVGKTLKKWSNVRRKTTGFRKCKRNMRWKIKI